MVDRRNGYLLMERDGKERKERGFIEGLVKKGGGVASYLSIDLFMFFVDHVCR